MNCSAEYIVDEDIAQVIQPVVSCCELPKGNELADAEAALKKIGAWLSEIGYRFTTITPSSHARVNGRPANFLARTPRDIFGWSRPFLPEALPAFMLKWMAAARILERCGSAYASCVRFSNLFDGRLFVHSAFRSTEPDSVYFGPDTHRFALWVNQCLQNSGRSAKRILELACGSGAIGIATQQLHGAANAELYLADLNERALSYTRVNLAMSGIERAHVIKSDIASGIDGKFDLIVASPPYRVNAKRQSQGGWDYGEETSLRIIDEALPLLERGGELFLYSRAAIVNGYDTFQARALPLLQRKGISFTYQEIDPDVSGEGLEASEMHDVDRVAAVGLRITALGL